MKVPRSVPNLSHLALFPQPPRRALGTANHHLATPPPPFSIPPPIDRPSIEMDQYDEVRRACLLAALPGRRSEHDAYRVLPLYFSPTLLLRDAQFGNYIVSTSTRLSLLNALTTLLMTPCLFCQGEDSDDSDIEQQDDRAESVAPPPSAAPSHQPLEGFDDDEMEVGQEAGTQLMTMEDGELPGCPVLSAPVSMRGWKRALSRQRALQRDTWTTKDWRP